MTSPARQVENPAGLVVDQHEAALAIDRQHAVAHVGDHVAEEHVVRAASTFAARLAISIAAEPG